MHQSAGKRKRELETEQNIPNKHFKADTEHVNIKFSEDYAHEMYLYLKEKEREYTVPSNYLAGTKFTGMMRTILLDWLVQVQQE